MKWTTFFAKLKNPRKQSGKIRKKLEKFGKKFPGGGEQKKGFVGGEKRSRSAKKKVALREKKSRAARINW